MLVSLFRSTTTFTAFYRLSASSTGAALLIGASSICQYKDGSRIHEASVSAKNPSMGRTRVLPSSGLCWTVICQPRGILIKSGVLPSINPIPIPFGEPAILSAERRRCMARSIPPNIREPRYPPTRQPTQGYGSSSLSALSTVSDISSRAAARKRCVPPLTTDHVMMCLNLTPLSW